MQGAARSASLFALLLLSRTFVICVSLSAPCLSFSLSLSLSLSLSFSLCLSLSQPLRHALSYFIYFSRILFICIVRCVFIPTDVVNSACYPSVFKIIPHTHTHTQKHTHTHTHKNTRTHTHKNTRTHTHTHTQKHTHTHTHTKTHTHTHSLSLFSYF
jgi:hypothetical protein